MKKVLLVEDDKNIVYMLKDSLEEEGFSVIHRSSGDGVVELFVQENPDIVLLDITLEGHIDGFTLSKKIRLRNNTPIIFITGHNEVSDVKKGFQIGNVDYLKKPFSISELILRINELLGRQQIQEALPEVFKLGNLHFRSEEHVIDNKDESVRLQKNENEVLKLLCLNKNRVVTKQKIVEEVWGEKDPKIKEASLNNVISSLRSKLASDPIINIITIPKEGYKLTLSNEQ